MRWSRSGASQETLSFSRPYRAGQALTTLLFIIVQNLWLGMIAAGIVGIQALVIPRMIKKAAFGGRQRQLTALSGRVDGVSLGTVTTNVDPKAWRIIDGKLYISYDPGAAEGTQTIQTEVPDSKSTGLMFNRRLFPRNSRKTGSTLPFNRFASSYLATIGCGREISQGPWCHIDVAPACLLRVSINLAAHESVEKVTLEGPVPFRLDLLKRSAGHLRRCGIPQAGHLLSS